jgi:hypothetical protein
MHRFAYLNHPLLKDQFLALRKERAEEKAAGRGDQGVPGVGDHALDEGIFGFHDDEEDEEEEHGAHWDFMLHHQAVTRKPKSYSSYSSSTGATEKGLQGVAHNVSRAVRSEQELPVAEEPALKPGGGGGGGGGSPELFLSGKELRGGVGTRRPAFFNRHRRKGSPSGPGAEVVDATPSSASAASAAAGAGEGTEQEKFLSSEEQSKGEGTGKGMEEGDAGPHAEAMRGLPRHIFEDDMFGTVIQWLYVRWLEGYK